MGTPDAVKKTDVPAAGPFDQIGPVLRDRVVLVSGGAQGIGRGVAQAVLAAGGKVMIGDIDVKAGEACLAEWEAGEAAAFLKLDVASEASVSRFVGAAQKRFGAVHGLVNNAGVADPQSGPLEELSLKHWRQRLGVNLDGAFLCAKHALPQLRQVQGAVVNIASSRALQSEPHTEAYAASKGALLAFTHALAMSAGPEVRVNAISPGWIVTDPWRKLSQRQPAQLSASDHAQHPVGRAGTPEDIGALAVFLLSSQAGFITGENFVADGGMVRKMQYL